MSCGVAIMKFTLIFFNVIFMLIGITGVGLGIWIAVSPGSLFGMLNYSPEASSSLIQTSAYVFIAGCAIILVVSALGIFGACTGNRCLLGVYGFFVILIFALELAALITVIVYDQEFRTELKAGLSKELQDKYTMAGENFKETVDTFQREFECCGINSSADYSSLTLPATDVINGLPKSCYPTDSSPSTSLYTTGCYDKLKELVEKFGGAIIGIVVAVLVFEIILFTFAMCLCRHDDFGDKVV